MSGISLGKAMPWNRLSTLFKQYKFYEIDEYQLYVDRKCLSQHDSLQYAYAGFIK